MVLRRPSLVPVFSSEQSLPASTDPYLSPRVRRSQGPSSPRVMPPPNPPRVQRLLDGWMNGEREEDDAAVAAHAFADRRRGWRGVLPQPATTTDAAALDGVLHQSPRASTPRTRGSPATAESTTVRW
ncbi:hypothetical protein GUJ93_ZPchr0002g25056 [Zizania palustris]|uniref:Uncharacterized protein n=1 Tax=Zizania palustris TaxID=103762 RepID=A0A8J5RZX2_ZIZPA|nr:hypothetical protein GUJ93_ZPchr0002g25056 [Zizania palustris]